MEKILSFSDFNLVNEQFNFVSSDNNFDELSSYVELSEDEMVSLLDDKVYEAAPKGNTVSGGLFDFNDSKVYNTVKNVKTAIIGGAKYTFLTIGEGMKAYAEAQKKVNVEAANILLNFAKFSGKVIVFTLVGVYVVTEVVANGLLGLATSIFGFIKKGLIGIGSTIVTALKNVNDYAKKIGKSVLTAIKNDALAFCKMFMEQLYALANTCAKIGQAITTLTYAAYKISKTVFKSIANFASECIYSAAKKVKVTVIKIGKNIEDFYNSSVKGFNSAKQEIIKTTKDGLDKAAVAIKKGVDKTKKVATKIKNDAKNVLVAAQNKIAQTGKEIQSIGNAIWKALWDHEIYKGTSQDIFESYIFVEGQKYYVLPENNTGLYYF